MSNLRFNLSSPFPFEFISSFRLIWKISMRKLEDEIKERVLKKMSTAHAWKSYTKEGWRHSLRICTIPLYEKFATFSKSSHQTYADQSEKKTLTLSLSLDNNRNNNNNNTNLNTIIYFYILCMHRPKHKNTLKMYWIVALPTYKSEIENMLVMVFI